MANRLTLAERIQAIEVELATIREGIDSLPDDHDVDIDELQSLVTDIINSVFDHARNVERVHNYFPFKRQWKKEEVRLPRNHRKERKSI